MSLDTVEELAVGYSERVTKSHLSRIENGQAEPSFRRLFTLSQIYGVPTTSLAEQFEVELKKVQVQPVPKGMKAPELLDKASMLCSTGRYQEALVLYDALLESPKLDRELSGDSVDRIFIRLNRIGCLIQMSHFLTAKEEAEEILDLPTLNMKQQVIVLQQFANSCFRLGKYTVAMLSLDRAEQLASSLEDPRNALADLAMIKGNIHLAFGDPEQAIPAYQRAEKIYGEISKPFEQCRTRRNLAAALIDAGKFKKSKQVLKDVLAQSQKNGYERHTAFALSDLAAIAWKENELDAAEFYGIRSNNIARPRDYLSLVFRNSYYLWKVCKKRKDAAGVRTNERTLRSYVSRADETMTETREFRSYLAGGAS